MPHLLLVDDEGRELFRGAVSEANVEIVARFVKRNAAALHGLATFTRSVRELLDQGATVVRQLETPKKTPRRVPLKRRRA